MFGRIKRENVILYVKSFRSMALRRSLLSSTLTREDQILEVLQIVT
jgi:hypothetical protein